MSRLFALWIVIGLIDVQMKAVDHPLLKADSSPEEDADRFCGFSMKVGDEGKRLGTRTAQKQGMPSFML